MKRRLSRYGCRNCKLRKVKCDETRPQCKRCSVYGVRCNFVANTADLQPMHQHEASKRSNPRLMKLAPLRPAVSNAVWIANGTVSFSLDTQDQELFNRFRHHTILSLGGEEFVDVYEGKLLADSFTCPALMHAVLAITAAHSHNLASESPHRLSGREAYHAFQGTSLFSTWLRRPIDEAHKDAIWATAILLTTLSFAAVEASSYKEAWPLKTTDGSDLQWLRLKESGKVLWAIVDPMRSTSIFHFLSKTFAISSTCRQQLPEKGADGIPEALAELCGIDQDSSPDNNIYWSFAHALSPLLEAQSDKLPFYRIFAAIDCIPRPLQLAIEQRDPVALALFYIWYSHIHGRRWWVVLRTQYELPAIRAYLKIHRKDAIHAIDSFSALRTNLNQEA